MCDTVDGSCMATTPETKRIARSIEKLAVGRVLDHLHQERKRGISTFPLTELSEATALAPPTVAQVMEFLEETGSFRVERVPISEIAWNVRGSPYELDGWESDAWNGSG